VGLIEPFHCRIVGHDPYCPPERAEALGVELMGMPQMAGECDVLIVLAALTDQTRHLVDADILAGMKPDAVLVNMARGPIVDEAALVQALDEGRLAAAGLDVFENEPPLVDSPLLKRDDVVLAPHCLAWTDEMSRGNGNSCVQAVLDVAAGRVPTIVVNTGALERPGVQQRLARNQMEDKR
jgi:phosphoglycerate dehydrogenase-like enzyme